MQIIALLLVTALGISWVVQMILCYCYTRAMRSSTPGGPAARADVVANPPRIRVIMPLRGADPFLRTAIRSVIDNPYPRLTLQIVLDSPQDPAREVVDDALRGVDPSRFRVDVLRDHAPERSLVCSSVLQAVNDAGDSCDQFAFCAADTIVPRDWYWHFADALSDPAVGCTLGNRWYQPVEGRWGSLVRQAWNAGAAVLMWLCKIPWGGAATLRPQDIRRSGMLDDWKVSLVEDVTIYQAMRRIGLRLKFVPELTNVNCEEVDLAGGVRFIQRQMLWARLYHPWWLLIVGHSLAGGAAMVVPVVAMLVAAASGAWSAALLLAVGFSIYLAGLLGLLLWVEETTLRVVSPSGRGDRRSTRRILKMLLAIPLTQVVYPVAVLACHFARRVDWRGIRYDLVGGSRVRMVEYVPFAAALQPEDGRTSI